MSETQIGIRENRMNFILLVVTNFFVGSMVGLERTILPIVRSRYDETVTASTDKRVGENTFCERCVLDNDVGKSIALEFDGSRFVDQPERRHGVGVVPDLFRRTRAQSS